LADAIRRHRDELLALLAEQPGGATEAPANEAAPGPSAPDAKGRGVADPAPRPDDPPRRPDGEAARATLPLDEAAAPYYGDKLPPPLGDAITSAIDRLWNAGCQLRPFPSPTIAALSCPTCDGGTVELTENDDGSVAVTLQCDCGPTRLLRLLRGLPVTIYYKPPTKRPAEDTCRCCGESTWWHSIYGLRICRTCHEPAHAGLERRPSEKQSDPV